MINHKLSRRKFLGQASCAAVGSTSFLSTLSNFGFTKSLLSQHVEDFMDYKALVCFFMPGGNDTFNLLIPRDAAYAEYATVRGDLAIPQNQLLPINPTNNAGRPLALHPGAVGLRDLFESGHLSFLANVGSLVRPTTKLDFENSYQIPYGVFSHSDQQEQWQTSIPDVRSGFGWAGRLADKLSDVNASSAVSMNISVSGNNLWQVGNQVYPYTVSPDGAVSLDAYGSQNQQNILRKNTIDNLLAQDYQNALEKTFKRVKRSSLDAYDLYKASTDTPIPADNLGQGTLGKSLRQIAKAIAGRNVLGVKRQIFYVQWGGWDFHDEVLANMEAMIPIVSDAMKAFYDLLEAIGVQNNVITFSASEFGRSLTTNNRGSDHAWGGNQWIIGGDIQGQQIFGQYPDLYEDGPLDTGRGRFIPTTSVDELAAELCIWLGIPKSELPLILPNISRFYNINGSTNPIGFVPLV